MHHQRNWLVHGNHQRRRNDVVAGIDIVGWIEPEEILVSFVNFVRMQGTKFSVGPGVAEIKTKLFGLHLDWERVGSSLLEINLSPGIFAEDAKRENLRANQSDGSDDNEFGATGQVLGLTAILALAKEADKAGQHQLCGNEGNAG